MLTHDEKKYILTSLQDQLYSRWHICQFSNYDLVDYGMVNLYLGENANNSVFVVSEPIYIRENTLSIIFFSTICSASGFGGGAEFSIFKYDYNQWQKYIEVSGIKF